MQGGKVNPVPRDLLYSMIDIIKIFFSIFQYTHKFNNDSFIKKFEFHLFVFYPLRVSTVKCIWDRKLETEQIKRINLKKAGICGCVLDINKWKETY